MALNIWRRFEELIAPAAEEVVTITAVHSDGTVTATSMTGNTIRLRSAVDISAGDKAFAAAGEVKARAPALIYYEIEV
ncbi:MAG: hypothetical protein CSA20_08530 [Deltaproteobacteria bacterium]|nr:MAG: hypothetical protein CSA20_08530 [Deltaproteobacteria bacterium]